MNGRISSRTAALASSHRLFHEEYDGTDDEDDGSEYWGASFSFDISSR